MPDLFAYNQAETQRASRIVDEAVTASATELLRAASRYVRQLAVNEVDRIIEECEKCSELYANEDVEFAGFGCDEHESLGLYAAWLECDFPEIEWKHT